MTHATALGYLFVLAFFAAFAAWTLLLLYIADHTTE